MFRTLEDVASDCDYATGGAALAACFYTMQADLVNTLIFLQETQGLSEDEAAQLESSLQYMVWLADSILGYLSLRAV